MGLLLAALTRHSGKCYATLRIIVGLLFTCHGAQKLFGVLGGTIAIHKPIGLAAGLIEFVAGALVAFGFCARAAAFLASGEMAVAYFMVCASSSFWPIANGGEMAVLYCFVFLYISFRGSGLWSLDSLLSERE
jgi:putative oxidoreductase